MSGLFPAIASGVVAADEVWDSSFIERVKASDAASQPAAKPLL